MWIDSLRGLVRPLGHTFGFRSCGICSLDHSLCALLCVSHFLFMGVIRWFIVCYAIVHSLGYFRWLYVGVFALFLGIEVGTLLVFTG